MNDVKDHVHKWRTSTKPNILMCSCDTVAELSVVLHNIEVDTARLTKIRVLGELLFRGDLKKDAHDRIYAWIMAENGLNEIPNYKEQRQLL